MKITVEIVQLSAEEYRARCPALPGCVVSGQSHEEVMAKANQAIDGYLASLDAVFPWEIRLVAQVSSGLPSTGTHWLVPRSKFADLSRKEA
jgi:predicted RNase H-like HicB family nuclease